MMRIQAPSDSSPVEKRPKGQIFIIIAVAFLALVAFVGLAVDVGLAFIAYGELARSVDSAALAAAAQFREGRDIAEMQATAENSMTVNGVNFTNVLIEACDYSLPPEDQDPQLCTNPKKKLVRVTVWADVPLAFMRVLGFDTVNLSASAISEAASMDVVLVIDISESMAWDAPVGDPMRDPAQCNAADSGGGDGFPGECQPFEDVKRAAHEFVARILNDIESEEQDRVAIVTFGNGWSIDPNMGTQYRTTGWSSNVTDTLAIVDNLSIFEPDPCQYPDGSIRTEFGPCTRYDPPDSTNFVDIYCISCNYPPAGADYSPKTSTNIGGGMLLAGNMFAVETREDALWVVVMLTDGQANATMWDPTTDDIGNPNTYPIGFCPGPDTTFPLCQDEDISTRHADGDPDYDADDYARDMSDFVGCYPVNEADACNGQQGQGAVIFAIGLGDGVTDNTNETNDLPYGVALLRYIAAVGDDGDAATDPCEDYWEDEGDWERWCGNYYFSPEGAGLEAVFADIASRVFTRLAR